MPQTLFYESARSCPPKKKERKNDGRCEGRRVGWGGGWRGGKIRKSFPGRIISVRSRGTVLNLTNRQTNSRHADDKSPLSFKKAIKVVES